MNPLAQFLRVARVRIAPPPPSALQLDQEANEWVIVLRNPGCRERPEFSAWVRQSPEHLRAFREAWELDELLRHMGPDPLRAAAAIAQACAPKNGTRNGWARLKKHPIATATGIAIAVATLTWTVAEKTRIESLQHELEATEKTRIEPLKEQIETLKAQLAASGANGNAPVAALHAPPAPASAKPPSPPTAAPSTAQSGKP